MKALFHGGIHPAEKKELIQGRMPQVMNATERTKLRAVSRGLKRAYLKLIFPPELKIYILGLF